MKPTLFVLSAAILTACGAADSPNDNAPSAASEAVVSQEASSAAPTTPAEASLPASSQDAPETAAKSQTGATYNLLADPDGVTELKWDDLMPVGEDEVLTQLYETYYSNLRQDMVGRSQRLEDLANNKGEEFDVSSLISEGAVNDTMEQIGTFNVVEELDGLNVRLPGYVVPLDFSSDGEYTEFLLVPYFGACLHTPPPPPNQIVYIKSDPATKVASIYEPVWVEGLMKTGQFESETGDSAYELTLSSLEAYEY